MIIEYKFQFNDDSASCLALDGLIKQGWGVKGFKVEDGYTWFIIRCHLDCSSQKEK